MKTIIVTGGNRGIGREICRQLGQAGHRVILGSRDLQKGREAAKDMPGNVITHQLDVTDEESILGLFEFISSEFGKIDVLINNAGINKAGQENENKMLLKVKSNLESSIPGISKISSKITHWLREAGLIPQRKDAITVPMENVKAVMDTNLYGPWRMIQAFLPLMMKSKEGRIINMSSGMGELASLQGDYPAYRLSKTSLNALTIMFARELEDKDIKVNAMCPGWVRTDMGGPNATRSLAEGADTAIWLATEENIPTGKFFRDRKEIKW